MLASLPEWLQLTIGFAFMFLVMLAVALFIPYFILVVMTGSDLGDRGE